MNRDTWNTSVATGACHGDFRSDLFSSTATCVVMASAGYPGDYPAGKTITGIDEAERLYGVVVFHAGTKINADGKIETAGGRVLGVTARAATLGEATARAYEAVSMIRFNGMQYRKDIGAAH